MEISFQNRVRAADHVLVRELEGESVLLNLNSESYFGLDDVGTRMWCVLTSSETVQDSFDVLAGEFDVSGDQLRTDLTELIEALIGHGLVEIETR